MKKYRIILLIFFSFLIFYLLGCNKDTTRPDFNSDNTQMKEIIAKDYQELFIGDVYNPFKNIDNDYSFTSENEDVVEVNNAGYVSARGQGNAKVLVYKKANLFGYVIFEVAGQNINYNCSEEAYLDFINRIDKYNANNATCNIKFDLDNNSSTMTLKLIEAPFYYEALINKYNKTSRLYIKKNISGNYVLFTVDEDNKYISRQEITDSDTIDSTSMNDFDLLDYNKIELNKKNNNQYELKVLFKDIPLISSIFDSLVDMKNFSYGQIGNNVINLNFKFENDKLIVDMDFKLHYINSNQAFNNDVKVNLVYTFGDASIFDTSNYQVAPASSFNDITETDTLDDLNNAYVDPYGGRTSCIYLEKGTYSADMTGLGANGRTIVYDKNQNELDVQEFKNVNILQNIISIEKSDYYYIKFKSGTSADCYVTFTKLNYSPKDVELFKTSSGRIEGKWDYKKFYYNSTNENEVLKITNNSNHDLYLYYQNAVAQGPGYYYKKVNAGKVQYMNPEENTIVYVISSVMEFSSNEYQYDYDFTVESVINANGSDYDNLDEVTTEFGKEYMIGYTFAKRKLLLKAEKKGLYKFSFTGVDSYSHAQIHIDDGTPYGGQSGPNLELDAGQYVIVLTTNDHLFDICSIKYEYVNTEEMDVDIDLITYETHGKTYKNGVLNLKATYTQIVRYHFQLTEETLITYGSGFVYIYDSNGKKVSLNTSSIGDDTYNLKLKAGSYYAVYTGEPYSKSGEYEHNKVFMLGIDAFDMDHYFDPNDVPLAEHGKEFVLDDNFKTYMFMCFKYVAQEYESIRCSGTNISYEIFDENFNKNYGKMEAGKTYYFIVKRVGTYTNGVFSFIIN